MCLSNVITFISTHTLKYLYLSPRRSHAMNYHVHFSNQCDLSGYSKNAGFEGSVQFETSLLSSPLISRTAQLFLRQTGVRMQIKTNE